MANAKEIQDRMKSINDTLKITNADIFGVSQGGMIAQYLAIDRPDLVNQLVLAVTLSKNNETVERTVNDWIHITEQNNICLLYTSDAADE